MLHCVSYQSLKTLELIDETMEELHLKHPEASPLHDDLLLEGQVKLLSL